MADWATHPFASSVALSTSPPSKTPPMTQAPPPQRQLSAGEGSCRPPATTYRISLSDGATRALLHRDVPRGPTCRGCPLRRRRASSPGSGPRRAERRRSSDEVGAPIDARRRAARPPRWREHPASSPRGRRARGAAPAAAGGGAAPCYFANQKIAGAQNDLGGGGAAGPNSPRRAAAAKRIFQGAQEGKVAASRRVFGAFVRGAAHRPESFLRGAKRGHTDRPRLQTHRSRSERS